MTDETLEQKIARLQQVPKGDSNYAESQFRLGYIFENNKNDIDNAIHYYKNIVRHDLKEIYATAQYNLGCIFINDANKNNIEQAIIHFSRISYADSKEEYNKAQFNLGLFYMNIAKYRNIDKTKYHFE